MQPDAEFISEPITPDRAAADTSAMARGLAGLPPGFTWRDQHYLIAQVLEDWKRSDTEGGRPGGERYYHRHYYRICTDTNQIMTIYFVRHPKSGESAKKRWWLYSIDRDKVSDSRPNNT
jgi:hypothetical protein